LKPKRHFWWTENKHIETNPNTKTNKQTRKEYFKVNGQQKKKRAHGIHQNKSCGVESNKIVLFIEENNLSKKLPELIQ